jgi:uncharacterized membrane protein YhaH (DUF805 family)
MPREMLSCPYCNSSVVLPIPGQVGQRVHCSRCQESFPYRPGEQVEEDLQEPLGQELVDGPRVKKRWSNGALALAIVAGMATIAVLTLTFAELTVQLRRSHDVALPGRRMFSLPAIALAAMLIYVVALGTYVGRLLGRRDRPLSRPARFGATALLLLLCAIGLADVYGIARRFLSGASAAAASPGTASGSVGGAPVAPADLAAFGYLPSDTNVLLGVQVRETVQQPLGQEILERWQVGPGETTLAGMVQASGFTLAELDHVVASLRVDDSLLPRVRVVVRTRDRYDPDRLRASLKAGRPATRLEKTIYRFNLRQTGFEAVVWFADDRTVVFALTPEDVDDVPLKPAEDITRLAAPLQQALAEMKSGTLLWLAGYSGDWQKSLLEMPLLQAPRELQTLLKQVKSFAAWLELREKSDFHVALGCADTESVGKVGDYLARQGLKPGQPLPFLAQRPATRTLGWELGQSLQETQKGEWLHLTASATPDLISQALENAPR